MRTLRFQFSLHNRPAFHQNKRGKTDGDSFIAKLLGVGRRTTLPTYGTVDPIRLQFERLVRYDRSNFRLNGQ